ncbi:DUF1566 domain-containing protein [bacterium]|nr:DUF1566 domain-containing protein [bacterium]
MTEDSTIPTPKPTEPSIAATPTEAATVETETTETTQGGFTYPIVDTGQSVCYNDQVEINCPQEGEAYYGQDAQVSGAQPTYQDNGDGTVTDLNTSLIWAASPDLNGDGAINIEDKLSYEDALAFSDEFSLAGYADWRLPTIKELYSLIQFTGTDPSAVTGNDTTGLTPFIDTAYFDFAYGDTTAGERIIDAQMATSTLYTSTTMGGNRTIFGVNFADGRIKGYPVDKLFYVYYVRGETGYGENAFVDNGDGTMSDTATGLMWAQDDSGEGMDWEAALAWVQEMNDANYLGYNDWRLPNAKELQSLVDYDRSPDATGSAAIDPLFNITAINNEVGQVDYPVFWSSTTHANTSQRPGFEAVYVAFGRAMGNMRGGWQDVHGAGAQRSDPKSGDASQYAQGRGPQGDAVRIENFVRLVRDEG